MQAGEYDPPQLCARTLQELGVPAHFSAFRAVAQIRSKRSP